MQSIGETDGAYTTLSTKHTLMTGTVTWIEETVEAAYGPPACGLGVRAQCVGQHILLDVQVAVLALEVQQ